VLHWWSTSPPKLWMGMKRQSRRPTGRNRITSGCNPSAERSQVATYAPHCNARHRGGEPKLIGRHLVRLALVVTASGGGPVMDVGGAAAPAIRQTIWPPVQSRTSGHDERDRYQTVLAGYGADARRHFRLKAT
jgi:hypothetical protein